MGKGNVREALGEIADCLTALGQLQDLHVILVCAENAIQIVASEVAAQSAAQKPDLEKATRVLGWLDYSMEILNIPRTPREKVVYHQMTEHLQGRLGNAQFMHIWTEGKSVSTEKSLQEIAELFEGCYQPKKNEKGIFDSDDIGYRLARENARSQTWLRRDLQAKKLPNARFASTLHRYSTSSGHKTAPKRWQLRIDWDFSRQEGKFANRIQILGISAIFASCPTHLLCAGGYCPLRK